MRGPESEAEHVWRARGVRFTTCASCDRPYIGTSARCLDCREARMKAYAIGLAMVVVFLVGLAMAVGR